MNIYALKAPAQSFKIPAWVTVQNAELAGAALVIILLVFAVLRLSKGRRPAPAPVPVPKKSGGSGLFLLIAAAIGGWWLLWGQHATAATGVKAVPAPSPSPSPTPTVTQTVAPPAHSGSQPGLLANLTAWMNHLTGTDWVLIVLIGAVATYVIVRPLLRRGD